MGNETSSMKIHDLLSAEDLKNLRENFPGNGNETPKKLDWKPWINIWPEEYLEKIEGIFIKASTDTPIKSHQANGDSNRVITFSGYQDIAGNVVRGTPDERIKLVFALLDKKTEHKLKCSVLLNYLVVINKAAGRACVDSSTLDGQEHEASVRLGQSLIHDLIFSDTPKNTLYKNVTSDIEFDFDTLERWLVMKCPLFDTIYQFVLAQSFCIKLANLPNLIPIQGIKITKDTTNLTPQEILYLNQHLPTELRIKWRPLFNSKIHGESFSKLSAAILNKGPSLIIIWEEGEEGNIFGAFASQSWKLGPQFYGDSSSYFFNLKPRMYVYESTTICNSNFQYMNLNQKTMPNGLGMGGQFDYFGIWLDGEYGKARCAPSCSTFHCPQMSKKEYFNYAHLEVYGLGDEPDLDSDDEKSVLDRDPEAQAMMEMMGKTFISKDIKAADENDEKNKKADEVSSS